MGLRGKPFLRPDGGRSESLIRFNRLFGNLQLVLTYQLHVLLLSLAFAEEGGLGAILMNCASMRTGQSKLISGGSW